MEKLKLKKLVIKLLDLKQMFNEEIECIAYAADAIYADGRLTSLISISKQLDNLLLNFNAQTFSAELQKMLQETKEEISRLEKEKDNYASEKDKKFVMGKLNPLKAVVAYFEEEDQ